jgi:hypothetical protein
MSSVRAPILPDCDSDAPKNLFDFVAWKRRQLRQNRLPSNRAHDTVVAAVTQIAVTLTRRQGGSHRFVLFVCQRPLHF